MLVILEQEQYESDIIKTVEDKFGVQDLPFTGITYIMPDGKFLDLQHNTHHSDVEKFLIDTGKSEFEYKVTQGSQTMYMLGAIRCDTTKWYMVLSERQPTDDQYKSILAWLDYLGNRKPSVEIYTYDNQIQKYNFADMISDDILDKIRRFYIFGKLYGHKIDSVY